MSTDPGDAFNYSLGSANATKGNWNATNWSSPEADALIAQGFTTTDPAQRLDVYSHFSKVYATAEPYVPLFTLDATVALSSSYGWPTFSGFWRMGGPWALGIGMQS